MRNVWMAALLVVLTCPAVSGHAEDFPEPDALPVKPELPDPLVMRNGKKVTSREDWFARRKPELRALFAHYMYGHSPTSPLDLRVKVEREDSRALDGKATKKEVTLSFGPADAPRIHLLLFVPNERKGPAPAFLGLNFYGNHTVVDDPSVPLTEYWVPERSPGAKGNKATEAGRGAQRETWRAAEVVGRGYALATFYCGDVAPDHPGHEDGIHPHYPGYDWGTVAAWAWGLSRGLDYLVTDKDVDPSKIAVVGHSRLGKAAIVAGAFDDRFAIVMPHQAGCGGTAPSRGKVGESVTRINTAFPHWFNAEFKLFNDRPERLPIDQNCLAAMVAPRPLLFTNAVEDTWANPEGQFQVLKAAAPVYALLGAGGLNADTMPPVNKLIDSTLGYAIRPGKHSMTAEDWTFFLDFADTHFGRKGKAK